MGSRSAPHEQERVLRRGCRIEDFAFLFFMFSFRWSHYRTTFFQKLLLLQKLLLGLFPAPVASVVRQ